MTYSIGIDLGGTKIKIAVVSPDGDVLEWLMCDTNDDSAGSWAITVKEKVREIQKRRGSAVTRIAIASPGLAALDGLSIANMQGRMQGLEGLIWTNHLQTDRPVLVLNDAHAALLGEVWKGAAFGYSNVVLLTLGTGVGGAVLANGKLLKGHLGRAGHLGHISLNSDGPPDNVGTPGSLEEMIGNLTIRERSEGRFGSTFELVNAHLRGDAHATRVWLRSIYHLAVALTSIINSFDPEVIIIGGGIASAGAPLFDPLRDYMKKLEWRPMGYAVPIIPAALGDTAGPLGAVFHSLHESRDLSGQ